MRAHNARIRVREALEAWVEGDLALREAKGLANARRARGDRGVWRGAATARRARGEGVRVRKRYGEEREERIRN